MAAQPAPPASSLTPWRYMSRASRRTSRGGPAGRRCATRSTAASFVRISPVSRVATIRASDSSTLRWSQPRSPRRLGTPATIARRRSAGGTGSMTWSGGGPYSERLPASARVTSGARFGKGAGSGISPRSNCGRSQSPNSRSATGAAGQGRSCACCTTVSSTDRAGPRFACGPEISSNRPTIVRRSSFVVGRPITARTSRSLVERSPPSTADPWRYAPIRASPRASRLMLTASAASASSTRGSATVRTLHGPEDEADDDRTEDCDRDRADERLRIAVAEAAHEPAADHGAEHADDDRRQAALDAARPHEPAGDAAGQEPDDDPGEEVVLRHGRDCAATAPRASGGRDVLGQPEHVFRVVAALDGGKPFVCPARVRGADASLALVPQEVDVGAVVGLPERLHRGLEPGLLLGLVVVALVEHG